MKEALASLALSSLLKCMQEAGIMDGVSQLTYSKNAGYPSHVIVRICEKVITWVNSRGRRICTLCTQQVRPKRLVVLPFVHSLSHGLKSVERASRGFFSNKKCWASSCPKVQRLANKVVLSTTFVNCKRRSSGFACPVCKGQTGGCLK